MSTNYETYEDIYDTLCLECALGNITLEEAERVNEKAFEKYVSEKNQLDYYAANDPRGDQNRLFSSASDVTKPVAKAGKKFLDDMADPHTKIGKAGKVLATPVRAYGNGLEKMGQTVGKAVEKKPVTNSPNLVSEYNKRIQQWGKKFKVGGVMGPYLAMYTLTPVAGLLGKLGFAAKAGLVVPRAHDVMNVYGMGDEDIRPILQKALGELTKIGNKAKALCQKFQGEVITPQVKGEFDKINAEGLAAIRRASTGMGVAHESSDENTDIVALFKEAGSLFDSTGDAIIYAINHADYTNPNTVQAIDDYIENYM